MGLKSRRNVQIETCDTWMDTYLEGDYLSTKGLRQGSQQPAAEWSLAFFCRGYPITKLIMPPIANLPLCYSGRLYPSRDIHLFPSCLCGKVIIDRLDCLFPIS